MVVVVGGVSIILERNENVVVVDLSRIDITSKTVVTCKINTKTFLQMFYFTCNHGLSGQPP